MVFAVNLTFKENVKQLNQIPETHLEALLRERALDALVDSGRGGGRGRGAGSGGSGSATGQEVVTGPSRKQLLEFSEKEKRKLVVALGLSRLQVDRVIDLCKYVFEQCKYHGCTGSDLEAFLKSDKCGMAHSHARIFSKIWQLGLAKKDKVSSSSSSSPSPRSTNLGFGSKLESFDWDLGMNLSHDGLLETRDCFASLSFKLFPDQFDDERITDNFSVEFSHEQLSEFFLEINKLQESLDEHF